MKRFFLVLIIVASAFGAHSFAPKAAKAGGLTFGIGIGYGYGRPFYRPRYYRPFRPRYVRPRYYRPRYVRPRTIYRRRAVRRGFSAAHYASCSRRYRSYRALDNTFQPYRGGRRQCRSRY